MTLFSEMREETLCLRPCEEWDLQLQEQVTGRIRGQLAVGVRSFLVDLACTTHIKYRVLEGLKQLHREVRRAGGELALSSPSFYLLEVLAAGDVPRTIPVYPSEASAAMGICHASAAMFSNSQEGERRGSGLGI